MKIIGGVTEKIDAQLRDAGILIHGVSRTSGVNYRDDATKEMRAQGDAMLAAFDWESEYQLETIRAAKLADIDTAARAKDPVETAKRAVRDAKTAEEITAITLTIKE